MQSRRHFLSSATSLLGLTVLPLRSFSSESGTSIVISFEAVETSVSEALSKRDVLRSTRAVPVVVGSKENLEAVREPFEYPESGFYRPAEAILDKASRLRHPDSLRQKTQADLKRACESIRALFNDPAAKLPGVVIDDGSGNSKEMPEGMAEELFLGDCDSGDILEGIGSVEAWPSKPQEGATSQELLRTLFRDSEESGFIIIVPTDDWTEVPAYLSWGGWNENPSAEYHVAAWRSWRERYGAELVGLSHDTLVMRVGRKPADRAEALALAKEMYLYCHDIVDQGLGNVGELAAWLMVTDAWYFWWD